MRKLEVEGEERENHLGLCSRRRLEEWGRGVRWGIRVGRGVVFQGLMGETGFGREAVELVYNSMQRPSWGEQPYTRVSTQMLGEVISEGVRACMHQRNGYCHHHQS